MVKFLHFLQLSDCTTLHSNASFQPYIIVHLCIICTGHNTDTVTTSLVDKYLISGYESHLWIILYTVHNQYTVQNCNIIYCTSGTLPQLQMYMINNIQVYYLYYIYVMHKFLYFYFQLKYSSENYRFPFCIYLKNARSKVIALYY